MTVATPRRNARAFAASLEIEVHVDAAPPRTTELSAGVRMPRIGFAYNQKPDSTAIVRPDDETRGDEEPPSSRRDAIASRNSDAPASTELAHSVTVGGNFAAPASADSSAPSDDEFAEWDSAETIDAVANALAALGDVIRLEANADFPQNL